MQKSRFVTCPICGHLVEVNLTGRPRRVHDDCRKLEQLFLWQEKLLDQIEFKPDQKKKIRGRCWSMANILNRAMVPF